MIVSFNGNFKDVAGEGLVEISKLLEQSLKQKGIKILFNEPAEITHVHTNGFFIAIKCFFSANKPIISFYGNIDQSFLLMLQNHLQYLLLIYNENNNPLTEVKHVFFSLLSTALPLFIKKLFINSLPQVIVPSEYFKKTLKNPAVKVIKLGIDAKKFHNKKYQNKKTRVAFFGHNAPLKGVIECIKAFGMLRSQDLDFNIYLTKHSKRTERFAKKYNKNVKVHGFVEDISEEYNKCDIIVLPFWSSGGAIATPLVLLESMACERAIVTSKIPHIQEIVKDSALLVNPFSPKQIAHAINRLAENKKLRTNLGKKARQIILKEHTIKKMSEEYYDFYFSMK